MLSAGDKIEDKLAILKIARCMYSHGVQGLSDAEYDDLLTDLVAAGVEVNPIYEDDPIPYREFSDYLELDADEVDELLRLSQPKSESAKILDFDFLAESESLSISPVFSFEEAYTWFCQHEGLEIVISTKIDGINTRRGYRCVDKKLNYIASLTRGRRSDPLDVTKNMAVISPKIINTDIGQDLIVYSETVALREAISALNEKYGEDYTIPRGLAVAMMRTDKFEADDYKYLKSFVFRVDYGAKLSDGLVMAKQMGFDVVPYVMYTYNGESFSSFKLQMQETISHLKGIADGMDVVTDGMVAEVNDRTAYTLADVNNNYSTANLAMKIGLWQPGVYTSVVKHLDLTQQAERCTCVAVVEPVITKGGQKVSRVNCYNPSVLFANKILPGKVIKFEYKNETTVNLIV